MTAPARSRCAVGSAWGGACHHCLRCSACLSAPRARCGGGGSPVQQLSLATCAVLSDFLFPHPWAAPGERYDAYSLICARLNEESLCEQRCLPRLPSLLNTLESLAQACDQPSFSNVAPMLEMPDGRCVAAAVLMAQLYGVLLADMRRIANLASGMPSPASMDADEETEGGGEICCDVEVLLDAVRDAESALKEAPHAADWRAAAIFAGEVVRSLYCAAAAVGHVYWLVGRFPIFMAVGLAHVVELHSNGMASGPARDLTVVDSWVACVRDLSIATGLRNAAPDAARRRSLLIGDVFTHLRELAPQLSHSFGGVPYCFCTASVESGVVVNTPELLLAHGANECLCDTDLRSCDTDLWLPGGLVCREARQHVHEVCYTSALLHRLPEVRDAVDADASLLYRGGPARNRLTGSQLSGPLHPPHARIHGERVDSLAAGAPGGTGPAQPSPVVLDRGVTYPHVLTRDDLLRDGLARSEEGARAEALILGSALHPSVNSSCSPRQHGLGSGRAFSAPLERVVDLPLRYCEIVRKRYSTALSGRPGLTIQGPLENLPPDRL